jgi:hypothetical protein
MTTQLNKSGPVHNTKLHVQAFTGIPHVAPVKFLNRLLHTFRWTKADRFA